MHSTKRQVVIKFILLLCVMVGYFIYLSWKFDIATGGIVSLLTWSFFVLCTPIADAGFLLDFPLRLLFGIRMLISEIVVWIIAILINIFGVMYFSEAYQKTLLTSLFEKIITNPYPYWAIVLLSGAGTFLSVKFGDELMDAIHPKDCKFCHRHRFKHSLIVYVVLFLLIFSGYYHLLDSLNIKGWS